MANRIKKSTLERFIADCKFSPEQVRRIEHEFSFGAHRSLRIRFGVREMVFTLTSIGDASGWIVETGLHTMKWLTFWKMAGHFIFQRWIIPGWIITTCLEKRRIQTTIARDATFSTVYTLDETAACIAEGCARASTNWPLVDVSNVDFRMGETEQPWSLLFDYLREQESFLRTFRHLPESQLWT